jgi:hypothetical protein
MAGHGPLFAVTSVTRASGTWRIVADGGDYASVRAAAETAIGSTSLSQQQEFVNLEILPRPLAIGRAGVAALRAYEGTFARV